MAFQQYIRQVATPFSQDLADRLLAAAEAMAVEPGTIARVPGGDLVVDPGGLGDIPGRYAPYMTDEDLVLAFIATGETKPALTEWPVIPEELMSFGFKRAATMTAISTGRAILGKPRGPWLAALAAAGVASGVHGIYDAVNENRKEHSDYFIFIEMVARNLDPELRQPFIHVLGMRKEFRSDEGNPGTGSAAP